MNIDRRGFLVGVGTVISIAGITVPVDKVIAANPEYVSPILTKVSKDGIGRILRANYPYKDFHEVTNIEIPEMSFMIEKIKPDYDYEGQIVLPEASPDILVDYVFMQSCSKVKCRSIEYWQKDNRLKYVIERTKNSIARETRRGKGNHFIIPTKTLNKLSKDTKNYLYNHTWNKSVTEFTTDFDSSPDWIFVYYRGPLFEMDTPGLLQGNKIIPNSTTKGRAFSYGRKMIFNDKFEVFDDE